MEHFIKNFFTKIFENISDLNKCKEMTLDWNNTNGFSNENKNKDLVFHLIAKNIRYSYQDNLKKYYRSAGCREYGINVTLFVIWLSDKDIIDYTSCLVILEDILETFPINDVELLFDILENNFRTKSHSDFNDRKLILLKISNSILKRLSASMDTQFRGRVQMVLSSIFPISDKSGVNQKGLYNFNNISNWTNFSCDHYKSKLLNFRFYKQFWIVHKYLTNPFLLFSQSDKAHNSQNDDNEPMELLNDALDSTEMVMLEPDVNTPRVEIFLNNIMKILSFFEKNQINLNDKSNSVLSYPKYLTSPNLFDLQLNDSSFRKTILTQFLIVLKSFLRPVSQVQKKYFTFSDTEKNKINEVIDKCSKLLNLKDSKIETVFLEEEIWEKWKENGCTSYEKLPDDELKKEIAEAKAECDEKLKNISKKYQTIKAKAFFKIENPNIYDFNKQFEVNLHELRNIGTSLSSSEGLSSENPFLGTFVERVLKDEDPSMEIPPADRTINADATFHWKFLRLVSQYDISRLSNEAKPFTIAREYADKYAMKSSQLPNSANGQNNIKDSPVGGMMTTTININSIDSTSGNVHSEEKDREKAKEKEKEKEKEKDGKFLKKKRSPERNDKTVHQSTSSSNNKKHKSG